MTQPSSLPLAVLLDGLTFPEGPRWHLGELYFSDFFTHRVIAVDPAGRSRTVCEVASQPSGLGWLPDGRLLVVSMLDRKLLRLDPAGLALHADLSGSPTATATTWRSAPTAGRGSATSGSITDWPRTRA